MNPARERNADGALEAPEAAEHAAQANCLLWRLDAAAEREALAALGQSIGKPVAVAGAGGLAEVMATVQRHRPGLIITDLPDGAAGHAWLTELHACAPEAPVLIYSRAHDDASAAAALRAGAFDVIARPAPERLAVAIDRALDHAAIQRSLALAQRDLAGAHHADFLPLMMEALAHDLRNMLQPLTYAAQLVKRSSDAGLRPLRDALESSTQRGLDIVSSMLAFGRNRFSSSDVVDVQELMRTLRLLLPKSLTRRIAVSYDSKLTMVQCRAQQIEIEQCLLALARRAIRQIPDGGRLTFRITSPMHHGAPVLSLSVEHQGGGTGRSTGSAREDRELLLCRVLSARHGGWVRSERTPDGAETVEILLPLRSAPVAAAPQSHRVLVAADDVAARALVDAGVAAGFRVAPVSDSAAAAQYIHQAPLPDFAVIDADLPRLEGARVFSLLRQRAFTGRTILLISPGSEFGRDCADDSVLFMTKPVDGRRVFAALNGGDAVAAGWTRPTGTGG